MFEYKLIKSNRRTFSIEIDNYKNIIVRAPFWAKDYHIKELIREKEQWIIKKCDAIDNQNKYRIIHTYKDGDIFDCYGEKFKLIFKDLGNNVLLSDRNYVYINNNYQIYARKLILRWYKEKAKKIIIPRTFYLAERLNMEIAKVKISNAKTRFGSCSSNKNLNFSWRLIIAPKEIVDYIIIHELAHTLEMNHSKKFWNIVASILPNYEMYEDWLKINYIMFDI